MYRKNLDKAASVTFRSFDIVGKVTREMIEAEETVQAIRQLTETFDEDSHEYPLIATGPANKKFKVRNSVFVCVFKILLYHSIRTIRSPILLMKRDSICPLLVKLL